MVRAVVLVTMLAACSPSEPAVSDAANLFGTDGGADPANDGARSGARLKLTWFQFTDGTKQFNAFYDAQLKALCYPQYQGWADGNNYCTPLNGGTLVYTNSTCTAKALYFYVDAASACPSSVAQYYLDYQTVGCNSLPAQLYQVGAKSTATSYYYMSSNGTCGGANTVTSSDKLYALGTAIPAAQLVKLTSSAPEGSGRLGVRYLESSDGMRFPSFMHDAQLDADCNPSYAEDGDTAATCFPRDGQYAFYAHDAACAQPELDLQSTCTAPAYAYTYPSTSCPSDTYTYYPVTGKISGTPLFYPTGATCTATTASSGEAYYSLGGALSLAPMTYAADTGTDHRIQLIHYTSPANDGNVRFRDPYKLFDSQMNTECYPETLPDGTIRCVAYGAYVSTYFANSACTVPIDVAEIYTGPATCTAPVIPKYARKSIAPTPGTCDYTTEVHPVTTVHTAKVYSGGPGACAAFTPYEEVLYNVGDVVPLTDFVAAAVTQDN